MKKLTTVVMLFLTIATFAQKNLFEAMIEFDGQEYKCFRIYDNDDGFKIAPFTQFCPTANFTVVKNKFDKSVGITKYDIELKKDDVRFRPYTDEVDHYSQPAKLRNPSSVFFETFVMIDGLLFELKETNKDLTKYDVNYSFIWVPIKAIQADKDAKQADKDTDKKKAELDKEAKNSEKKQKFGAFMKNIADKAKAVIDAQTGGSIPTALKEFKSGEDVRNKINSYLVAMKKKQGPYTAQEKQEMTFIKNKLSAESAAITKENDDYWASPAGQARLKRLSGGSSSSSSSTYTIQNNSSSLVSVVYNGYTSDISAGSSISWDCGKPVYYKVLQEGTSTTYVAGGLISSGEGVCGKTVNIN